MGDYVDGWDFENMTPICLTSSKYVCFAHCAEGYYNVEQQNLFKHELCGESFFVNLEFCKSNLVMAVLFISVGGGGEEERKVF